MEKPTLGALSFSIHLWNWKNALKMKHLYKPTHFAKLNSLVLLIPPA